MVSNSINKSHGLTLIELLVVLAVAAVLAQIALPDFSDIMKNNRSTARINEVQTSLTFARSEAVKRNVPIVLCKSTDGTSCEDSGSVWQSGWIVFADQDRDGTPDDGEVLTLHGSSAEQFTLTFDQPRVVFDGSGMATAGLNGTFVLCDDRPNVDPATKAKGLIIGPGGRARVAIDTNGNDIVEDADDDDIDCPS